MKKAYLLIPILLVIISHYLIADGKYQTAMIKTANDTPIELIIDANHREYKIGGKFFCDLIFKNRSNTNQKITYYRPNFWFPIVKELDTGNILRVSGEIYDGPVMPVNIELQPQASEKISASSVHLITAWNQLNENKLICKPGKYNIQFKIPLLLNDKETTLVSNITQINIME